MKTISNLQEGPKGFLLQQTKIPGRIHVSAKTGDILLDEGFDDECYYGAVVPPSSYDFIELVDRENGSVEIVLGFGGGTRHSLGVTEEHALARTWVENVNRCIQELRSGEREPALDTRPRRVVSTEVRLR